MLIISNLPPQLPLTHKVNPNFESDAKLTSVVRRLEALELSKGAQSSAPEPSKPVVSPVCVLCDSQDHLVEQCPGLPIIKVEQANVLNTFRKPNPNNNPFSETYNPGWRNHPNLSWKSPQGQGYSGSSSFQGPSSNNQFHKGNQFNATPYVPPNQRKPSLEDTLQQFMQSQLITNKTKAQICHNQDQTIVRLEVQIER